MNAIDLVTPTHLTDDERAGLPPWTYFNKELFQIEQEELFRRHWQLACHVSDIPKEGDWTTFDIAGERALIARQPLMDAVTQFVRERHDIARLAEIVHHHVRMDRRNGRR